MKPLVVVTWLWGNKYGFEDVLRLEEATRSRIRRPLRFFLMTERERVAPWLVFERHAIKDPALLKEPGNFARLRLFDTGWQRNRRIENDMLMIGMDCPVLTSLNEIVNYPDDLVIVSNSAVYLKAGKCGDVWTDFSLEAARKYENDLGWIDHKYPGHRLEA